MLLGHLYDNNSIVNIEEIGEGSSALLCLTDNIQCCWPPWRKWSHWYFPNGSYVGHYGAFDSLYRNRGPSVVHLHRRNNATMPNGVFHCTIPDINGIYQNIYVGIYSLENGKLELIHIMLSICMIHAYIGSPAIISVLFERNTTTLICTSTPQWSTYYCHLEEEWCTC